MVIMGWVVNAEPLALPAAAVVSIARVAMPKVGVMLWVAVVKEPEVKVRVYAVPAVPLMPTSEKVATPATALTVAVPTVVPLPLTVMITEAVLVVTMLPKVSLMVIMGWVVNAEPLAEPAAGVVIVAWVAVPKTLATWTALPLVPPKEVTTAVRLPRDGAVAKVMVNWVAVALVTVPVPVLRTTVLLAAVVSNPVPAMVRVVALLARVLPLFNVTVGVVGENTIVGRPPKVAVQPVVPAR